MIRRFAQKRGAKQGEKGCQNRQNCSSYQKMINALKLVKMICKIEIRR
uniref:Uncharacterized protein n=1 Tax=Siphoviridae sp. ct7GD8 TaxID=2827785 RepID=A0A8S5T5K0_9CAUD|nr:MAG TPA: hypothetical protein [Siphoviridae sp. ct7GD8]